MSGWRWMLITMACMRIMRAFEQRDGGSMCSPRKRKTGGWRHWGVVSDAGQDVDVAPEVVGGTGEGCG